MLHALTHNRFVWLAVGLIGGLILGGFWPQTPLHAVATDRYDTFAIATGPLDDEVEAVFFLDFLTGDLRAAVLGKTGIFNAFFEYNNVFADLGVNPAKNPKFLMVTGIARLQRAGQRMYPGNGIVYVAEITTGKVAAYAVPWNAAMRNANMPIRQTLMPLHVTRFRPALPGEAAVVPGG